jgi:hypothetical protein
MDSISNEYSILLKGWLREAYDFINPVIILPHLVFKRDLWTLEQVAKVTTSKPGLWPLIAPSETSTTDIKKAKLDIEKWATPEGQLGLFKKCIPSPIFCTNEYVIVNSLIGNSTMQRLLPPEVVAPADYLKYEQIGEDANAQLWNTIRNNIDGLKWMIMRCGYDNDHFAFVCCPRRVGWVEELIKNMDQKSVDHLQLEKRENVLLGRGLFSGKPFDEQLCL